MAACGQPQIGEREAARERLGACGRGKRTIGARQANEILAHFKSAVSLFSCRGRSDGSRFSCFHSSRSRSSFEAFEATEAQGDSLSSCTPWRTRPQHRRRSGALPGRGHRRGALKPRFSRRACSALRRGDGCADGCVRGGALAAGHSAGNAQTAAALAMAGVRCWRRLLDDRVRPSAPRGDVPQPNRRPPPGGIKYPPLWICWWITTLMAGIIVIFIFYRISTFA